MFFVQNASVHFMLFKKRIPDTKYRGEKKTWHWQNIPCIFIHMYVYLYARMLNFKPALQNGLFFHWNCHKNSLWLREIKNNKIKCVLWRCVVFSLIEYNLQRRHHHCSCAYCCFLFFAFFSANFLCAMKLYTKSFNTKLLIRNLLYTTSINQFFCW